MGKLLMLQQYSFAALGPMYISATLKKGGHECILLIEPLEKNMFEKIKKINPDIVGFTVFTGQQDWTLKWAKMVKSKLGIQNIMGGPHITYNTDIIDKYDFIDIICQGEGEFATLELMNKIDTGEKITNIKNLSVREDGKIYRNGVRNLSEPDELPFPDRELYYRYPIFRQWSVKRFITGRGCPFQCIFCHNHLDSELYKGKGIWTRKRSPEKVIEEIKEVWEKYPLKIVNFDPDDYFLNVRDWAFEFLEMYAKEIALPFIINTRPESIDEEMTRALKRANCRSVALSVESGDEKLRNGILRKMVYDKDIFNAIRYLKKEKIITKTYNMVGIPGETTEQAFKTLEMNVKLKPDWARCAILYPYPNTALWKVAVEKGLINPNLKVDDFLDTYMEECLMDLPNKNELINLQRFFSICVQFPFLIPIVKKLIKLPPNFLFDKIELLAFGYFGVKYFGHSIGDVFRFTKEFLRTHQPC